MYIRKRETRTSQRYKKYSYDEESKSWDLYEVKSSTKAKENYVLDATMQAHVVSKIIPIRHVYLVLIDTSYENKTKNTIKVFKNLFKNV